MGIFNSCHKKCKKLKENCEIKKITNEIIQVLESNMKHDTLEQLKILLLNKPSIDDLQKLKQHLQIILVKLEKFRYKLENKTLLPKSTKMLTSLLRQTMYTIFEDTIPSSYALNTSKLLFGIKGVVSKTNSLLLELVLAFKRERREYERRLNLLKKLVPKVNTGEEIFIELQKRGFTKCLVSRIDLVNGKLFVTIPDIKSQVSDYSITDFELTYPDPNLIRFQENHKTYIHTERPQELLLYDNDSKTHNVSYELENDNSFSLSITIVLFCLLIHLIFKKLPNNLAATI